MTWRSVAYASLVVERNPARGVAVSRALGAGAHGSGLTVWMLEQGQGPCPRHEQPYLLHKQTGVTKRRRLAGSRQVAFGLLLVRRGAPRLAFRMASSGEQLSQPRGVVDDDAHAGVGRPGRCYDSGPSGKVRSCLLEKLGRVEK